MTEPTTAIGHYRIDPGFFDFDPGRSLDNLTVEQREEMNTHYRDAWCARANEILSEIDGWINHATGEIIAPVSRKGAFTEDMRDRMEDESYTIFRQYVDINEKQEASAHEN